jgi:hypothetical protein
MAALLIALGLAACEGGSKTKPDGGPDGDPGDAGVECSWIDDFDPAACQDSFPGYDNMVYVDGQIAESGDGMSWATAVKTVQEGIDLARCGKLATDSGHWEVWVKSGTYHVFQGCPEDTVRLRQAVHVYGGFAGNETDVEERDIDANQTVLDGRSASNPEDQVIHVVVAECESVLDGLTITGGFAASPFVGTHAHGGGLLGYYADLVVRSCTFVDNRADEGGGGVAGFHSVLRFEDCAFTANFAGQEGGGIHTFDCTSAIDGCHFDSNSTGGVGYGAGLDVYLGSVEIYDRVRRQFGVARRRSLLVRR